MNLTSHRRADEFAQLLESGVRGDDPVTGPLLTVADALRELPGADAPRPEFRAALRQRLVAVATVQGVGSTATPMQRAREAGSTWRVQRRLTALAAGAAVVTGVTGVAVGASRALPGDAFYGVKRAAEGAQLAVTVGTEDRGKRHLEFARTRLHEAEALAGSSSSLVAPSGDSPAIAAARAEGTTHTKLIADTLHEMDVQTRAGANDLFQSFRDSGSREPLQALNTFTREQYSRLQALVPALPAGDREQARASLTLLTVVAADTLHLAGVATPTPPTTTPGSSGTTPSSVPSSVGTSGAGSSSAPSSPSGAPGGSVLPTSGSLLPTSGSLLPTGGSSAPAPSVSVPTVPVPSSLPSVSLAPPSVPTIPAILPTDTPLPTQLPSLSDLNGLLGP